MIEGEIQELKSRILKLEAKVSSIKNFGTPVIPGNGWKVLESWRKLKTGMDYEAVERILGPAHRIDGGVLAQWYYENGGRANFSDGEVRRWIEPDYYHITITLSRPSGWDSLLCYAPHA